MGLLSMLGMGMVYLRKHWFDRISQLILCFSIGTFLGNAFLHLLPHASETISLPWIAGLAFLGGLTLYLNDNFLYRTPTISGKNFQYSLGFSDALHSFVDGSIIAIAYHTDISLGMTTTAAILLHELPQELCEWGLLLRYGTPVKRILLYNVLALLTALIGAWVIYYIGHQAESFTNYLLPFIAGNFIYIALAKLLPELKTSFSFHSRNINIVARIMLGILAIAVMGEMLHH